MRLSHLDAHTRTGRHAPVVDNERACVGHVARVVQETRVVAVRRAVDGERAAHVERIGVHAAACGGARGRGGAGREIRQGGGGGGSDSLWVASPAAHLGVLARSKTSPCGPGQGTATAKHVSHGLKPVPAPLPSIKRVKTGQPSYDGGGDAAASRGRRR